MDILSHALWPLALAKLTNVKTTLKIKLGGAAFWGAFPDLFAFSIIFITSIFTGGFPHPPDHGASQSGWLFTLTETLYSFSHSLVVISIIILGLWITRRKIYYVLGGWVLHILADIPTHTQEFFPTPFLWPISSFTVSGFRWGQSWFMILNYSLLGIFFVYLYWEKIRNVFQPTP
jgi:hypothetical protein